MRKRVLKFVLVVLLLLVCSSDSKAALDQQFVPQPNVFAQFNETAVAQTFTVGITGWLTQVDVLVSQLDPVGNLIVEIQQGLTQGPIVAPAIVLTSVSVPLASLPSSSPGGTGPGFVSISLPGLGVSVSQGDEFAIVLHKDSGGQSIRYGVAWFGCLPNSQPDYPFGMGLSFRQADWGFDLDGNPFYLPDRWEGNAQTDFGFRTYVEPIPEPATITLLGFLLPVYRIFSRRKT